MADSRFVLGTVQLGMSYGLANTHGQPNKDEAFSILDGALARGIDTFDTAYAYGTAEDILGEWIRARNLKSKIKVISKMKPHVLNEYPVDVNASDVVQRELEKSLTRLGLDSLDGYLLHSPHYIYLEQIVTGLRKVKEKRLVENIGVSTYDEAEALQAIDLGVDYVQVPYNILDQRLDKTNFFEMAKQKHVTVFARSPFLQGLLLIKPADLPPHLVHVRSHLECFRNILEKYKLSPLDASLLFVQEHCRASHIVFGVETPAQLTEDLDITSRKSPEGFIQEVVDSFREIDRAVVNPSIWSKVKK